MGAFGHTEGYVQVFFPLLFEIWSMFDDTLFQSFIRFYQSFRGFYQWCLIKEVEMRSGGLREGGGGGYSGGLRYLDCLLFRGLREKCDGQGIKIGLLYNKRVGESEVSIL